MSSVIQPDVVTSPRVRLRSVQGKLLAYVVPLVLASTLAVFALFEWNARQAAEDQLQIKLEKLVRIQSAVLAESLWNVANQQIKLNLAALATDTDVLAAVVIDDLDETIAAVRRHGCTDRFPLFCRKRHHFTARVNQDIRIGNSEACVD